MRFPDGTQVRVVGLDEIMGELYSEGRPANRETGEEILKRLEQNNTYIPPSGRREYRSIVLKEYRDYVASQKGKTNKPG